MNHASNFPIWRYLSLFAMAYAFIAIIVYIFSYHKFGLSTISNNALLSFFCAMGIAYFIAEREERLLSHKDYARLLLGVAAISAFWHVTYVILLQTVIPAQRPAKMPLGLALPLCILADLIGPALVFWPKNIVRLRQYVTNR